MKKTFLFFLLFNILFSQSQGDYWYFGLNAGIHFDGNNVVSLNNGQISTYEGCTSISDLDGNLLFYTDGGDVYNKNHTLLLNGTDLRGNSTSTQSAVAVPLPGSFNSTLNRYDFYYLFTIDHMSGSYGVCYNIIDMSLDGGLGGIIPTSKNIFLVGSRAEKISVARHSNSNDFWIVIINSFTEQFNSFHLSSSGLNTNAVSSDAAIFNYDTPANSNHHFGLGQMKASPDNSMIAFADQIQDIQVYDFNNTTGTLSPKFHQIMPEGTRYYGIEFSPDSSKLYTANEYSRDIYQYDLNVANNDGFINSRTTVAVTTTPQIQTLPIYSHAFQLGPDDKIYQVTSYSHYLNVIHNPNAAGVACNFESGAIDLTPNAVVFGLPYYPVSINPRNWIEIEDIYCVNQSIHFSLHYTEIDSVVWHIYNSNNEEIYTTTDLEFDYALTSSGNYEVQAEVSVDEFFYTLTKEFEIIDPYAVSLSCGDQSLNSVEFIWNSLEQASTYQYEYSINGATPISGDTENTSFTLNGLDPADEVEFTITPNGPLNCFESTTLSCRTLCPTDMVTDIISNAPVCIGDEVIFTIFGYEGATLTYSIDNAAPQTITIQGGEAVLTYGPVSDDVVLDITHFSFRFCEVDIDEQAIAEMRPVINLEDRHYYLCPDGPVDLYEEEGYDHYQWLNAEGNTVGEGPVIAVNQAGTYTLIVTHQTCQYESTHTVTAAQIPNSIEANVTENNVVIQVIGGDFPYQYQLEDLEGNIVIPFQEENYFNDLENGRYQVRIQSQITLCEWIEPFDIIHLNNVLTPNGDGQNDIWDLRFLTQFPNARVQLYDRYGKLLYTMDETNGYIWNGKFTDRHIPTTAYWYILQIDSQTRVSGYILVKNR